MGCLKISIDSPSCRPHARCPPFESAAQADTSVDWIGTEVIASLSQMATKAPLTVDSSHALPAPLSARGHHEALSLRHDDIFLEGNSAHQPRRIITGAFPPPPSIAVPPNILFLLYRLIH